MAKMTNVIQHPMVNEHGVQGNIKKSINSSTSGSKMDHFPLSPLRLEVPTNFLLLREKKKLLCLGHQICQEDPCQRRGVTHHDQQKALGATS